MLNYQTITRNDWEYLQAESSKDPAVTLEDGSCGRHGYYTEHSMLAAAPAPKEGKK